MDKRPIGVFDSGVGGLTVLKEIVEQLPGEDIIYFGDTARVPYGTRSKETIIKYFFQSVRFLKSKDIKAIVVGCNTASALALEEAQEVFDIPFVGVVKPGAKAAVEITKNNKIGVIGTEGTIHSRSYEREIRKLMKKAEIVGLPCPLFVPIVEEGWEHSDVAFITAQKYLMELLEHGIDSLILGCTHYPALRYTIQKVMGEDITLVNPAFESAKALNILLKENNMLSATYEGGQLKFYVSDDPNKFIRVGSNLFKREIVDVEKVSIEDL